MSVARKPRPMPGSKEAIARVMYEVMGPMFSHVRCCLDLCEIADEEIEKAYPREAPCKRFPGGKPTDPDGLFTACCPNEAFYLKSETVYRHHVRELIERSRTKKPDYALATEAEVLLGMLEASKVAPLTSEGMLIVDRLFPKIMGKAFTDEPQREQWAHQYDEAMHVARRKVRTRR